MRGEYEEFQARGADIAAIGMGRPEMAAYFRDQFEIPFPLLVDHEQATYRAVEIRRGNQWEVAGPQVWIRYAKGLLTGKGVALPKQDVLQMGGVAVVDTDGKILFMHRGETSADNAPVEELLDALPTTK
ncbi:MAG: hypothetical protein QOH26_163 [Actinomycetota bacterium]|nr:hypothetical protein [Actinomycetota bacterium]